MPRRSHRTISMTLIRRELAFTLIAVLGLGVLSAPGYAADPCAAFKWDVAHERAVFAQSAETLSAAAAAEGAPQLLPEDLYALSLQPQSQLRLPVAPGKKAQFADAFAGLMRLHVSAAGPTGFPSINQAGLTSLGPRAWLPRVITPGLPAARRRTNRWNSICRAATTCCN